MNVRRTLLIATVAAVSGYVQAQGCSGGPDGGMDATGNQCGLVEATVAGQAIARADASRERGLQEYANGHYAMAVMHFRRAAEEGDARSAEILALMYRFGPRLYGAGVPEDPAESARWAALAGGRRAMSSAVAASTGR